MEAARNYASRIRSSVYRCDTPHPSNTKTIKSPRISRISNKQEKLNEITDLIEELNLNVKPSKNIISVGKISYSVDDETMMAMLLAGQANIIMQKILNRPKSRTPFDFRGRGRISKEEEDDINFMLVEDI